MGFAGHSPADAASAVAAYGISHTIGNVTEAHLGYARTLHASIPDDIKHNLRQPETARWVVLALAIGSSRSTAAELLSILSLGKLEHASVLHLVAETGRLGTRMRLPLIDLAMPALQQLEPASRSRLLEELQAVVRHDRRLTLFEFVLTRILADHLSDDAARAPRIRFRQYPAAADQIQLVLSLMVHASGTKAEQAETLFQRASGALLPPGRSLLSVKDCNIEALDQALQDLRDLTPLLKGPLLEGLADVARADGRIQVQEAELLRAVATLMDCPMPPLFPDIAGLAR
jgi:uncharacterized tellurite resistance protein B-like protein